MATRLGPAAEADLTTATATSSATAPPVRLWLQPTVIALVVVAAFIGCYVGLQRNPQPHRVPVAVAGQELSGEVSQVLGDSVDVHPVADAARGRAEVERRDVVAAISGRAASDRLRLEVGGANGQSTTTAVRSLIGAYAHGSGQRLTTVDVVPFARFDSRGLAGFYLAFGVTLAGFVLAQNVLGLANRLHLRHRFWLLSGASVAIGIVATVIAGPILGAVPAPVMPLAFALTLLAAAAAFTTKLLGTYLGPVGVPRRHSFAAHGRQLHQRSGHRPGPPALRRTRRLRPAAAGCGRARRDRPELLPRRAGGAAVGHPRAVGGDRRHPGEPSSPPEAAAHAGHRLTPRPG